MEIVKSLFFKKYSMPIKEFFYFHISETRCIYNYYGMDDNHRTFRDNGHVPVS